MRSSALILLVSVVTACGQRETAVQNTAPAVRPSILLVTLDTTRADYVGPDAAGTATPAFNALIARGTRFTHAYSTAPQTLPSHASMLTGVYPAAHGIHENARYLGANVPLVTEKLRSAGYRTAAFVSGVPLSRQFGLARGFDVYDDELAPGAAERDASETTRRALAELRTSQQPLFLWVHYFDPHTPYASPRGYRGEIEATDRSLGQLVRGFEEATGGAGVIVVVADHGEGLGEHGEAEHGYLLYQSVMRVPLVIAGRGIAHSVVNRPVSTRRVYHTLLDVAGIDARGSLRNPPDEAVLGEAMVPYLNYGWQPQVMAVEGTRKVIQAGALEVYDVVRDPAETNDLGATGEIERESRKALREYPLPSAAVIAQSGSLTEEQQRQLASLGYITNDVRPKVRPDAPRPRDMVHLFGDLDRASRLFSAREYRDAIPVLEAILARDPYNVTAALRIAAAHSALGDHAGAIAAFERARAIDPDSMDVRHYLALHYARTPEWQKALPLLEQVLAESPDRLPAIETLAELRERQGRLRDALNLRLSVHERRDPTAAELVHSAQLAMQLADTPAAISLFERAARMKGDFSHYLELGVLYLAARRYQEARAALDRVPSTHPEYPMALFKRAQVSVLLGEADRAERIARARQHADATTRELIARERLFR